MPQQYQLNPDPGASLRALLSQLYDKFSAPRPQAQAIPGMNTRNMPAQSPMSRMLGSLATNNDASGNIYAGAGLPEMSIGAGQAPTINQPGVSALAPDVVQRGQDAMLATLNSRPSVIGQMSSGTITPAAAPATPLSQPLATRHTLHRTPRRAVPAYDEAAMDQLTAAIADGTYEGPNRNIDDDIRARALAWALRNNPT